MPETKKPLPATAAPQAVRPGEPVAPVRRRLLSGGLAAGPVLMTLVSRPVLGTVQCVTPSAFVSGNASAALGAPVCVGLGPDQWVDNPNWPPPYTPDTPFCDALGQSPGYCCDTLIDALVPPDTSPPDPPAPPPPPGRHGHRNKHLKDDGPDPNSGDSRSHDRWTLNRGPTGHQTLDLGALRPKSLDLGSPGQQTLDPGFLGQKRLNVASATDPLHGHTAQDAGQRHGSQGDESNGPHHHNKHKNRGQDPGPVSDPPADPIPVDPLGCNNDPPTTSDPPSDPPPPSTPGRKRKNTHHGSARTPHDEVARHVVAAMLNAQAGLTPPLTVHAVKGMWRDYLTQGYYEPTAGVHWGQQEILTYLASTQAA